MTVGPSTAEVARLSKWVQMKGYLGWLGLNKKTRGAMRALLRREIKLQFRRAARRAGP